MRSYAVLQMGLTFLCAFFLLFAPAPASASGDGSSATQMESCSALILP